MLSFTHRLNFKLLACGSLALVMCALFASPGAMAACNKKGRGNCPEPTPTPPGSTFAELYSSNFDSGEYECSTAGNANTTLSGNYYCDTDTSVDDVYLSTRTLTGNFAQKNWEICHALDPTDGRSGVFLAPDDVWYGWTDDCGDALCDVEFRMSFSGVDVLGETSGKADQLNVTLFATIAPPRGTTDPFRYDPNRKNQPMQFDRIQLEFFRSSNGRSVGTCMWYTDVGNFRGEDAQAWGISKGVEN